MKIIKFILAGVFVLAMAVVATGFWFFKAAVPRYEGELKAPGLIAPVTVRADRYGVPHLLAQNRHDLFFAQGFITARERLFQMDLTRLAGRGELSSYFGNRTLGKDMFLKTAGFFRKARADYRAMSPEAQKILLAYSAGVNAFIKSGATLPREYFFLGVKPRPWLPEDCLTAGLLMAYSLTRSKKVDLAMQQVVNHGGMELYRKIAPRWPESAPTVSPQANASGRAPGPVLGMAGLAPAPLAAKDAGFDPVPLDFAASNWMIFSGEKTGTGRPVFTGSPDLRPTLPALFFLIHLKGAGFDVMGGSLPGVPGINVLGFNRHIAWSVVNGRGDELDYFIEKINPANPNQYLTETGWRDFKLVTETLRIKNGDKVEEKPLVVRISRHGPIVSGVLPLAPANCAMQWSGTDTTFTALEGLVAMNRATNFSQFRAALSKVNILDLVFGYADKDGTIGYQFTGSIPLRKKGDGGLPAPGWGGQYDWTGYVPFGQLPSEQNPKQGWLASFNNLPKATPYHLGDYFLFERAIRFRDMMKTAGKVDRTTAANMQLDVVSPVAGRWLPLVKTACAGEPGLAPYLALFNGWDGSMKIDSPAATLFNLFYLHLMQNTLEDEVGPEIWREHLAAPYLFYVPDRVMLSIADKPDDPLYDDRRTKNKREGRDDIIRQSLAQAAQGLTALIGKEPKNWKWGKKHRMHFEHVLGAKLSFLNLKPIPTNGDHHTINSGFWDNKHPFKMASGGVIRMVVDFNDPGQNSLISPPGQSGHYLSPHYSDVAELWANGGQIKARFTDQEKLPNKLVLKP